MHRFFRSQIIRKVGILLTCIALGPVVVILLLQFNPIQQNRNVSFSRKFYPVAPRLLKVVPIKGITHIIGVDSNLIHIQTSSPKTIIRYNLVSLDHQTLHLQLPFYKKLANRYNYQLTADGYLLSGGNVPIVIKFTRMGKCVEERPVSEGIFTRALALPGSLLLRGTHKASPLMQQLTKRTWDGEDYRVSNIVSGPYHVQGDLLLDTAINLITYVPYTLSDVTLLDTNLIELGTISLLGKTSNDQIESPLHIKKLSKDQLLVKSAPVQFRQLSSHVSNGLLYIRSAQRANNETEQSFRAAAPIDIFDLKEKQYLYSVKIKRIEGKPLLKFHVHQDTLIALYQDHLALYTLPFLSDATTSGSVQYPSN